MQDTDTCHCSKIEGNIKKDEYWQKAKGFKSHPITANLCEFEYHNDLTLMQSLYSHLLVAIAVQIDGTFTKLCLLDKSLNKYATYQSVSKCV